MTLAGGNRCQHARHELKDLREERGRKRDEGKHEGKDEEGICASLDRRRMDQKRYGTVRVRTSILITQIDDSAIVRSATDGAHDYGDRGWPGLGDGRKRLEVKQFDEAALGG